MSQYRTLGLCIEKARGSPRQHLGKKIENPMNNGEFTREEAIARLAFESNTIKYG